MNLNPTSEQRTKYEMMTYTGKLFDPLLLEGTCCIEDIAHHLALINRYNGATRVPYSVAEHCVRLSGAELPGDPLAMLLHDAAEAYVGDIIRSQKQSLLWDCPKMLRRYDQHESFILQKICVDLKLPFTHEYLETAAIKEADRIMAFTEIRDLLPKGAKINFADYFSLDMSKTLKEVIVPWDWDIAELRFLLRYKELTNGKKFNNR